MDAHRNALFLALITLSSADKGRRENIFDNLPCPAPEDISPCVCSVDGSHNMNMDCSKVPDEETLARVFSATLPSTDFRELSIRNNRKIKVLRNGVLGLASFQKIRITDGSLEEVEEKALAQSFATLIALHLDNNELSSFPFYALPIFTSMSELYLGGNHLSDLDVLISDSLTKIDLSVNLFGNLPANTFTGLKKIESISIGKIGLTEIAPGTFSKLDNVNVIDLYSNQLTRIPEGTFAFVSNVIWMSLDNNQINYIAAGGITGIANAWLSFYNNFLTTLSEEVFRRFFEDGNRVLLGGNAFSCIWRV